MTYDTWRVICLFLILLFFAYISSIGGFKNAEITDVLRDISISSVSAVVTFLALKGLEARMNNKALLDIAQQIRSESQSGSIARVDRNMNMGEQYWLYLIEHLDTVPEAVWFVGKRLSRWRSGAVYSKSLREKIIKRLSLAISQSRKPDQEFRFILLVSDRDALDKWRIYLEEILSDVFKLNPQFTKIMNATEARKFIYIGLAPVEKMTYSCVLCGDRLAVTFYTSSGRLEDSPTIDVRGGSVLRDVYLADMKSLVSYLAPL
jgi:hypothetical protein